MKKSLLLSLIFITVLIVFANSSKLHSKKSRKADKTTTKEKAEKKADPNYTKYEYPNNLIISAKIQNIANKGQTLKIKPEDCFFVRSLDLNKKKGLLAEDSCYPRKHGRESMGASMGVFRTGKTNY